MYDNIQEFSIPFAEIRWQDPMIIATFHVAIIITFQIQVCACRLLNSYANPARDQMTCHVMHKFLTFQGQVCGFDVVVRFSLQSCSGKGYKGLVLGADRIENFKPDRTGPDQK